MSHRAAPVRRWLCAALCFGAALPAHAAAQQCTGAGNWRTIGGVSPPIVTFSTPTTIDYDAQGIVYGAIVTVSVTSMRQGSIPLPWSLCVNADTPTLGSSQGVTKPLSDLQIEMPGGTWLPLTTMQQLLRTGNGNATVQFSLRIRLSWDADPPGSFGTLLRFTLGG